MEDHVKHELFDRYLRDELSERELDNFLAQLNDPEFAAEFEIHRQLTEGVKEYRRQELKNYLKENARVRTLPKTWLGGKVWLAAAVITAFVVSYIVLMPGAEREQLAQRQEPKATEKKQEEVDRKEDKEPAEIEEAVPIIPKDEPLEITDAAPDLMVEEKSVLEGVKQSYTYAPSGSYTWSQPEEDFSMPVRSDVRLLDSVFLLDLAFEGSPEMQMGAEEEGYYYRDTTARFRGAKKDAPQMTRIIVQLWKSPINYKGYRFDGRKLELFGLDSVQNLSLKYLVLDHDLEVYEVYVKYGDAYYPLVADSQYHAYRRETDKTILEKLK